MNIKQKITVFAFVVLSSIAMTGLASSTVLAATCGGVETSIVECPQTGAGATAKDTGAWGILILALNVLTAGVGILAVGGIVYGAIMYGSAGDNASQVQQAKDIIKNVVLGIILYGIMYLGLNFLIPGGIFA